MQSGALQLLRVSTSVSGGAEASGTGFKSCFLGGAGGPVFGHGLIAQTRQHRSPFHQLGLHLLFDLEGVLSNAPSAVVLQFGLESEDLAPQVEVFRKHAGALIFQAAYP